MLEATGKKSDKRFIMADEGIQTTMEKWKLPLLQLSYKAREVHTLPVIQNTSLSVSQFVNEAFTFLLFDGGITVHQPGGIIGWWDTS